MQHKFWYKINRIKYYFKIFIWAKTHSEQVGDYKFLLNLRDTCHNKYLEAQRMKNTEKTTKLKIQEDLINKILNYKKL